MKNKFIRIVSPISLIIALLLDSGVIYFAYLAYKKLSESQTAINIVFGVIVVCTIVLAVFFTREVLRHGIRFKEEEFEITALDKNNVFKYEDIEKIETFRDTKASFIKNFIDRYSKLTISLKDENTITIELGITTKRKLKKIEDEINKRI